MLEHSAQGEIVDYGKAKSGLGPGERNQRGDLMRRVREHWGVAMLKWGLLVAGGAILLVPTLPSPAAEASQEPIVRVEEDWQLVLNEPNDLADSPQFHTAMSPYGDLNSVYLQATWNYWEVPDFQAGGLQLQAWNVDECAFSKSFLDYKQFSTNAETVSWTQVLDLKDAVVTFEIINGTSVTWGNFGGGSMKVQGELYPADLNAYDPEVSRASSLISYGANRVSNLAITEVRYYGKDGLLWKDTQQRIVANPSILAENPD